MKLSFVFPRIKSRVFLLLMILSTFVFYSFQEGDGEASDQATDENPTTGINLLEDSTYVDSIYVNIIDVIIEDGEVTFNEIRSLFDEVYMLIVFLLGILIKFFPKIRTIPNYVVVAISLGVSVGIIFYLLGFAPVWKLVLSFGFTSWAYDLLKPLLKKLPFIGPILGGDKVAKPA